MDIKGAESLTAEEFAGELQRGAKVIEFSYCISLLVVTLRRSALVLVRPGESPQAASLPYFFLSMVLGWWGFPFGLIFTPIALIQNLTGGTDHTARFLASLPPPPRQQQWQQHQQQQWQPQQQQWQQPQWQQHQQQQWQQPSHQGAQSTYVRVTAPDGSAHTAMKLGQDGGLVQVRFADGREEWISSASVRSL